MEENRINEQEAHELDFNQMEQVSGGIANPTKTRFCTTCRDTTTWIFVNDVWICGKCAYGPGCQIVV